MISNLYNKNKLLVMCLVLVIIFYMIFNLTTNVNGQQVGPSTTYHSVRISKGDTLWDLALKYKDQDKDIKEYISEIKSINNIKMDKIKTGEYLILPVNYK